MAANRPENVDALLARMDALLAPLEERKDPIRFFLATYRRTTLEVKDMLVKEEFTDSRWVERWDVAFATGTSTPSRRGKRENGRRGLGPRPSRRPREGLTCLRCATFCSA